MYMYMYMYIYSAHEFSIIEIYDKMLLQRCLASYTFVGNFKLCANIKRNDSSSNSGTNPRLLV